ncbi:MAG: DUF192 domain-containing protein [Patescibacteria group bacterium]
MAYHKKKIIWLLVIYIVVFGLLFSRLVLRPKILTSYENKNLGSNTSQKELRSGTLQINNQTVNIEIAENDAQWYRGLSNRDSLCADCGMYFIFPTKDKLDFVMRDMRFPLDIIFIKDNQIINITSNLVPEGSKPANIYYSDGDANRVLEVNGGYCNKHGIKAGDLVSNVIIN